MLENTYIMIADGCLLCRGTICLKAVKCALILEPQQCFGFTNRIVLLVVCQLIVQPSFWTKHMFPILMSNYLRCLTNKTVVSVAGCDGTFSHGRATQPAHSSPVFCSNLLVSISSYYHRAFQKTKKNDLTHHTEHFFLEELTKWLYHCVVNPLDCLLSEDQNHL